MCLLMLLRISFSYCILKFSRAGPLSTCLVYNIDYFGLFLYKFNFNKFRYSISHQREELFCKTYF